MRPNFPFLSAATNVNSNLHRAASRAFSGCLPFFFIRLLLSEVPLPPLPVTLAHFALSLYDRVFRLPTSILISGLTSLEVKPRLFRSFWRTFPCTHPLNMLPPTSTKKDLFACRPSPPWHPSSFTVESTLSFPCSRSDSPLPHQGAAHAH